MPGNIFFTNLSKSISFAAAPLVLTPFCPQPRRTLGASSGCSRAFGARRVRSSDSRGPASGRPRGPAPTAAAARGSPTWWISGPASTRRRRTPGQRRPTATAAPGGRAPSSSRRLCLRSSEPRRRVPPAGALAPQPLKKGVAESLSHRLPDGVGTNGVFREGPQIPYIL